MGKYYFHKSRVLYWLITNNKTNTSQRVGNLSAWLREIGYLDSVTPHPKYTELQGAIQQSKCEPKRVALGQYTIERITRDNEYDAIFTAVTGVSVKRDIDGRKRYDHIKSFEGVIH